MNDTRNLVLAFALSALILFGWPLVSQRLFPTANPPATRIAAGKTVNVAQNSAIPAQSAPVVVRDRATVLAASPRVRIATPSLSGSINLTGGRVDDLVLLRHRETVAPGSPPIRLFSPSGTPGAYFAQFGWSGAVAPPADARWTASAPMLTPQTPVTLTWTAPTGQRFTLTYAVDANYVFTVRQSVTNPGAAPLTVRPFGLVSRTGEGPEIDSRTLHIGPVAVINGVLEESDVAYAKLHDNGPQTYQSHGGWLGITDKYWLAALIPDQHGPAAMRFSQQDGRTQTDFAAAPLAVPAGGSAQSTVRLFAGAKEVEVLDALAATGVPLFDRAIDWGHLYFIAQPIFGLLNWLFHLTGNYGIAIICLTFIVRGAMFPIAQRQFASMAKMRALMPRMKELQAKHKDDKVAQQKETMALYAQEKVNPLAGCLPIFIQMPIFFALYRSLFLTIEMRHQPFFGWIKDLSAPDPLTPVNLFGLLPFTPPHAIAIGVLPLLLGVTYYFQQKLNPTTMDEMQQKIFQFMPVVLTFIMAPFAAGLVVYWTTSNVITIAQQTFLMRRHPLPATPPAAA